MKRKYKIITVMAVIAVLATASYFILIKRSDVTECNHYSVDECPSKCVVCPPCEVCSSISCQTEEYWKSMGFGKDWYETYVTK